MKTLPGQAIENLFNPRSVAVVGASGNPRSLGSRTLGLMKSCGFRGDLYAVNPRGESCGEVPGYGNVLDVPVPLDLCLIAIPAKGVGDVVADCVRKEVPVAQILTSGFGEVSAQGRDLEQSILETAGGETRLVGPNCLGVYSSAAGITFVSLAERGTGRVSIASQSGGLSVDMILQAKSRGLGLGKLVSMGNCMDLDPVDFLEFFGEDPDTEVIGLYVEGVRRGQEFLRALRRVAGQKPVVVLKGGRTALGARSAASHTNALAGEYATWKAGLRQAGVISVDSVDEFLAVLTGLQGFVPRPGGRGVALVGNGGGATVLATDLLAERGMTLAAIGETTKAAIAALQLPPGSTVGNPTDTPVNALDKGGSQALGSVVNTLLRDPAVHELILHLNLIPLVNYENRQSIADGISQALSMLDGQGKPIYVAVRSAPEDVLETLRVQLLESARNKQLPCFHSAHEAIDAMSRIYEWCRRPRPATAPTRAPVSPSAAKRARARIAHLPKGTRLVPQDVAFELLDIFGIPHPRSILARSREEAVRAAAECGYPVALKVDSPDIVHKTEADGVRVGLRSEKEVAGAFDAIGQASRAFMPDAEIRGVLVQAMEGEPLAEVICGLKTDPVFGPVVLLGMGGTLVEILKDASLRVLPLGQEDPGLMWRDLGGARLLTGYRGKPPADTDAIEDLLERVSVMGEMIPEIAEMDLNPVMVKEKGAGLNVVDCRMIVTG